jgi:hypothetical protein
MTQSLTTLIDRVATMIGLTALLAGLPVAAVAFIVHSI